MEREQMVETHPFEAFVPEGIEYLIVGSFPGREHTQAAVPEGGWFYGARRNQFWKILEEVYCRPLTHRVEKEALFRELRIGIVDVIRSCVRRENSNKDENLEVVAYNREEIEGILRKKSLKKVFFTSRFVEKEFRRLFPEYKNTEVLPSPSPRYSRMSREEKARVYKERLPEVK